MDDNKEPSYLLAECQVTLEDFGLFPEKYYETQESLSKPTKQQHSRDNKEGPLGYTDDNRRNTLEIKVLQAEEGMFKKDPNMCVVEKLKAELNSTTQRYASLKATYDKEQESFRRKSEEQERRLTTAQQEQKSLTATIDRLNSEKKDLLAASAITKQQIDTLKVDIQQKEASLAESQRRVTDLTSEKSELENRLKEMRPKVHSDSASINRDKINAEVTEDVKKRSKNETDLAEKVAILQDIVCEKIEQNHRDLQDEKMKIHALQQEIAKAKENVSSLETAKENFLECLLNYSVWFIEGPTTGTQVDVCVCTFNLSSIVTYGKDMV